MVRLRERDHLSDRRLSSAVPGVGEAASDYFSTDKHYTSLARRIAATLRRGSGWVLITGDPPADPQALINAFENLAGVRYEVTIISCGPELTRGDLERAVSVSNGLSETAGAAGMSDGPTAVRPLILFDALDRLSDNQIEEVCKATLHIGQIPVAGVLLASVDFSLRLERSALHFLKEQLNAHLYVQDVGDDEAISFLHNQLLVQRDRQIEARSFRRGILMGLAASGVVLAAGIGFFIILNPQAEQAGPAPENARQSRPISEVGSLVPPPEGGVANSVPVQTAETRSSSGTTPPPMSSTVVKSPASVDPSVVVNPPADLHSLVSTGEGRPVGEEQSMVQPPQTALTTETRSSSATRPPPPIHTAIPEDLSTGTSPAAAHSRAGLQYSDAEIATLMRRGDAFLAAGDITSARLFYEHAANAGSGPAALQLGATYDPMIIALVRGGAGIADPAQALSWYRRASNLGMVEAEQRIKRFETRAEYPKPVH